MAKFSAVVFDMDGVLADSEPIYYAAIQAILEPLGHEITETHQREIMGHSIDDTWDYLQRTFGLEGPLDELMQSYDMELQQQLSKQNRPLPGVREILQALQTAGVPYAVASSSLPSWIQALLRGLELSDAIEVRISAVEVENPKPAPDIYLEAANRLGVEPARCIAIEDSPTGLAAAKAAGLYTIQLRAASTAVDAQPEADLVLDSLESFPLSLVIDAKEA